LAELFIECRVQTVGAFFTPLVAAFTLALAAVLLVLLPSLIEEIRPTANVDAKGVRKGASEWAVRLGNWLGGGVRVLGTAFKSLVPLGALAGSVLYLAFVVEQFAFTTGVGGDLFMWLVGRLEWFQGETLVTAGKWLAGGALTITALGSRFTETFGRLRAGENKQRQHRHQLPAPRLGQKRPDQQRPGDAEDRRVVVVSHRG
jgi:hypothetical protein